MLCRFLDYVVEETIAGRVNEIKEYTIGTRALGRPGDFNPQFDACVRIHAGRLRQMLHTYYMHTGKGDAVRIQIPKGTYVPIFSFVHEAQPPVPNPEEAVAALVPNKLTLAVLPFQNLGPETARNFFAEVLSEQLSTEISHFRNISVISYYSVRLFAHRLTDLKQLYSIYGIHYVLTGSVQVIDESIRINIHLIYTSTSEQVWVGTYDQLLSSAPLSNVSDDVTKNIASVIAGYYGAIIQHISITPSHEQADVLGTHNAAFWHYKYHKAYNPATLLETKEALEATLQIAPSNALTWAVLGEVYLDSYIMDINSFSIINYGMECARKAIDLDRYCMHGYQTLAWAYLLQKNQAASLKIIDECLAMNYSATNNIGWLGLTLIYLGEYERGKDLLEKAMELNPFYPWCYSFTLSVYYYIKEEYGIARHWAEKMNMASPKFDLVLRTAILGKLEREEEGEQLARELKLIWPSVDREIQGFLQKFILEEAIVGQLLKGVQFFGIATHL